MSTLQNLVVACQADDTKLRQQAQTLTENWQLWLAPINDSALICLLQDTGARNVDSLLNQQILPVLSQQLLRSWQRNRNPNA